MWKAIEERQTKAILEPIEELYKEFLRTHSINGSSVAVMTTTPGKLVSHEMIVLYAWRQPHVPTNNVGRHLQSCPFGDPCQQNQSSASNGTPSDDDSDNNRKIEEL